jgi:hypothetical protein
MSQYFVIINEQVKRINTTDLNLVQCLSLADSTLHLISRMYVFSLQSLRHFLTLKHSFSIPTIVY